MDDQTIIWCIIIYKECIWEAQNNMVYFHWSFWMIKLLYKFIFKNYVYKLFKNFLLFNE